MDTNFDPDAYLAAKDAPFDPDAYLADKQGQESALEAAGRGALRNIPVAQQAVAAAAPLAFKVGLTAEPAYSAELQHLTQAAEQGKKEHPVAYGAGAVVGTLAPALVGAPEGILANIGLGAGLNAAKSVSDTNLTQKPTAQQAKDTGLAALIGGGFGGIGSALLPAKVIGKAIAPKAAESAGEVAGEAAAPVAEAATTSTANTIAHTPANILPDATPVAPGFVPSADRIAASNWARAIGFTPRKFATFARDMGENPQDAAIMGQQWSQEKNLVQTFDHPGEALARVSDIKDKAGKQIGAIIDKFGTEPVPATDIGLEIIDLAEKTANPNAEASLLKVVKRMDTLSDRGGLDWDAMQELKGMVGKEVGDHPSMAQAYGILAKRINAMVDDTEAKIGDPTLRPLYESAKKDYRMGSLLEPALRYSEAKNLIGGPAGHNTLRGVLGQVAEALTGLPPAGQLVKNVMAKSAPVVKGIGKAGAAVAPVAKAAALPISLPVGRIAKNLPAVAQEELANYLQSQFGKKHD